MYENPGSVLGASTAAIILPATASAITGIDYLLLLGAFLVFLVVYNLVVKAISYFLAKRG